MTNGNQNTNGKQKNTWDAFIAGIGMAVIITALFVLLILAGIALFVVGNDANQLTVITAAFGVIGTLVGAYFGVKATDEARRDTQRALQIASIRAEEAYSRLPVKVARDEATAAANDRIAREVS